MTWNLRWRASGFGFHAVLACAVGSAALAKPVAGQEATLFDELGAFAVISSSDHVELPAARGFGASVGWEIRPHWWLRVSYHRVEDDTHKMGTVCDQYSQRINCRPEHTDTSVTFSGVRGSFVRTVPIGEWLRLGLGGGVSFNHVNARSVGESGLPADLLAPNAGQLGAHLLLSGGLRPIPGLPMRIVGGFRSHWVNFTACSGENPPPYDPFCGTSRFEEVEVGLAYSF